MMGVPRAGGPPSALHERFARRNGVPAVAAAVFACNDGRNRVLNKSVGLAAQLLSRPETNR